MRNLHNGRPEWDVGSSWTLMKSHKRSLMSVIETIDFYVNSQQYRTGRSVDHPHCILNHSDPKNEGMNSSKDWLVFKHLKTGVSHTQQMIFPKLKQYWQVCSISTLLMLFYFPKKLECKFVVIESFQWQQWKCSVDNWTVRVSCNQLFLLLLNSDVVKQNLFVNQKLEYWVINIGIGLVCKQQHLGKFLYDRSNIKSRP